MAEIYDNTYLAVSCGCFVISATRIKQFSWQAPAAMEQPDYKPEALLVGYPALAMVTESRLTIPKLSLALVIKPRCTKIP